MPQSFTLNAWKFDPAFTQYYELMPKTWTRTDKADSCIEGGSGTVDLSNRIVTVTITDSNSDNVLNGAAGADNARDTITVDGVEYAISAIYNGDKATIDGKVYGIITFYTENGPIVSLPLLDDKISQAFPCEVSSTEWLKEPNEFDLPIEEVPCFVRGARIRTPNGEVLVEDLRVGDLVQTRDNHAQEIRWIGSVKLNQRDLTNAPKLSPVVVRAGALGSGLPNTDLSLSRQHRILVKSAIARRMFGADEVLVAAKDLVGVEGIGSADGVADIEYFHILFDRHEIIFANGAEVESLFTGPEALKSVGAAALEEIFTLFPELADHEHWPEPARLIVAGRQARKLTDRHTQNRKALVN